MNVTIISNSQLISYCALNNFAGKNNTAHAVIEYNLYNPLWNTLLSEGCAVDVAEPLIIGGEAKTATLERKQQKLYKLSLEANQIVRISDSAGTANIVVSYGQISNANGRQGSVYISNSMQGDYYVLVSNNSLNTQQNQAYSLTARLMDMEITEVFADTIVRHGSALIPVEVIGCAEIPQFALVGQDGKHYEAENVHIFSETLFSAQFRVDSLAVGSYGLHVASGEKNGLKENAVYLKNETPRESLETKIILPSTSRIGTTITAYVEYVNTGNVDISAPLLIMTGTEGSTYQVGESEIYKDELHLMGLNAMGVLNRLRPGEGGRIEVKIGIPNQQIVTADYNLQVFLNNAESQSQSFYLQWLDVEPSIKPEAYTQEEWDGYISRLRKLTGENWGSFVEGLNVVEGLLWDNGLATLDAREVYRYLKELAHEDNSGNMFRNIKAINTNPCGLAGDVEPGTIFIWDNNDWKQLVVYNVDTFLTVDPNCQLIKFTNNNYFLSHGWNDCRYGPPAFDMAQALYNRHNGNCNIFTVDWSAWSVTGMWGLFGVGTLPSAKHNFPLALDYLPTLITPYHIKLSEIPIAGWGPAASAGYKIPETAKRVVANLRKVTSKAGINISNVISSLHLIGHSHGAHVCGLVAKELGRPKRMTALDASTDLSHINLSNWAGTGWKDCAQYVDYYKSSIMAGADHFHGHDNFILIEKDKGFDFLLRLGSQTETHRHLYAVDWYISTINGEKKSIPLGFNFNETVRNNLKWGDNKDWSKKPQAQWHGVINGTRNTIENLSIRDNKLHIAPKDWKYTEPWYSGSISGSIISDTKFRDALAGTFELAVNDNNSIVVSGNELKVGIGKQIDVYVENRADNYTIPYGVKSEALWYHVCHNFFLLPTSNLSTDALNPIYQMNAEGFVNSYPVSIRPEYTTHYRPTLNITEDMWKNIGGNDKVDYVDCYLMLKAGMYKDGNKDPFSDYWKGELYTENNTAKVKIRVTKSKIKCDAGADIVRKDADNNGVESISRDGKASSERGEITQYGWYWNGKIISVEKTLKYDFPVGTHTVTFHVSDGVETAEDVLTITIKPGTPSPPCCDGGGEGNGSGGGSSGSTSTIGSWDPNEKVGVKGAGDKDCVLPGNSMDYTIYFENDPEKANAPAQEVRVTDILDEAFDLSTFSFTGVKVANQDITVQNNVAHTSVTTDLRPDNNLLLRTTLNLDVDTRTVSATFTSLDTETGEFTTDPWAGFLPPNDSTHIGEGHFSYRVALKDNLSDGYEITNQATIYFDYNNPIATNTTSHIIDLLAPVSNVAGLPVTTGKDSVLVSWNGEDAGSGIKNFDIYVSDNGENYYRWKEKATETAAYFHGEINHTYSFFSIATDLIGHTEAMKTQREAWITMQGTAILDVSANPEIKVYPNPTNGILYIENPGKQEIEVYNILGELLLRTQENRIDMSGYPNGVYLLHINDQAIKVIKQ